VEHRDDRAFLVRDRLIPELRVDHLQPLMTEDAWPERVGRALVGTAVANARAHAVDERGLRLAGGGIESADPAHEWTVCLRRPLRSSPAMSSSRSTTTRGTGSTRFSALVPVASR